MMEDKCQHKLSISFFLSVFFLFLLLNLAELVNIGSFLYGDFFLVFLVLSLKSIFGSLIDIFPHFTDDFGELGDLGIGILRFDLIVNLLSKEEECG